MLILWIRKSKTEEAENAPQHDEVKSFPEHDRDMKKFSQEHPKIEAVPANRDIITEENLLLAPVHCFRLNKNAQN